MLNPLNWFGREEEKPLTYIVVCRGPENYWADSNRSLRPAALGKDMEELASGIAEYHRREHPCTPDFEIKTTTSAHAKMGSYSGWSFVTVPLESHEFLDLVRRVHDKLKVDYQHKETV